MLPNTPAKPPGVSPSSGRYDARSRLRPISGPGVRVICSTPTTSTILAAPAAMARMPWCTAAVPVAQAFSTRVAGLKRNCGSACSTSDAVKSCGEKPALQCPSTISSTSAAEMPASASASLATRTTRLSTVSVSNLPNGVCAHPTMLAVMVVLPIVLRIAFTLSGGIVHSRSERFHRPIAYGCYAFPIAGPDIRRRAQPGAADRDDVSLAQPRRRVGLANTAGRTKPRVRKRPRQRSKRLDAAGLFGGEEFDQTKAMGQCLHQFGCGGDPRRERQGACGGCLQQIGRRARADAEFNTERFRAIQIGGVQDGADADKGVRHLGHDRSCGLDRNWGAQRDFQHAHTARNECLGERYRVFKPFNGKDRDDTGRFEQRGEFFLAVLGRSHNHAETLCEFAGLGAIVAGIAERGMIAPG